MKKIVIPIIIAAALGVGGGVTAVMMNRANVASAEAGVVPEIKSGKYYLNGDKNSDLWIEVNPDFLQLQGNDIDKSLMDMAKKDYEELAKEYEECAKEYEELAKEHEELAKEYEELAKEYEESANFTDEQVNQHFDEIKALYCAEKKYLVQEFIPEQSKYTIKVSRDNKNTDRESLENSDAAFIFIPTENSISLGLFGDFILVED